MPVWTVRDGELLRRRDRPLRARRLRGEDMPDGYALRERCVCIQLPGRGVPGRADLPPGPVRGYRLRRWRDGRQRRRAGAGRRCGAGRWRRVGNRRIPRRRLQREWPRLRNGRFLRKLRVQIGRWFLQRTARRMAAAGLDRLGRAATPAMNTSHPATVGLLPNAMPPQRKRQNGDRSSACPRAALRSALR